MTRLQVTLWEDKWAFFMTTLQVTLWEEQVGILHDQTSSDSVGGQVGILHDHTSYKMENFVVREFGGTKYLSMGSESKVIPIEEI